MSRVEKSIGYSLRVGRGCATPTFRSHRMWENPNITNFWVIIPKHFLVYAILSLITVTKFTLNRAAQLTAPTRNYLFRKTLSARL